MSRWVFVRHAESAANAEGWLAGHVDTPLTERGRAQVAALASSLDLSEIERVYSSDLQRALDTARGLVGASRHIEITREIRERDLGEWEHRVRSELRATGEIERLLSWQDGPPGGESLHASAHRMLRWLAAHESGAPTLVVTHGAVLRATLGVLDDVPTERIGELRIRNATAYAREVASGTWAKLRDRITPTVGSLTRPRYAPR